MSQPQITEHIRHRTIEIDAPGGRLEVELTFWNHDDMVEVEDGKGQIKLMACDLLPLAVALQRAHMLWIAHYGCEELEALTKQQRNSRAQESKP